MRHFFMYLRSAFVSLLFFMCGDLEEALSVLIDDLTGDAGSGFTLDHDAAPVPNQLDVLLCVWESGLVEGNRLVVVLFSNSNVHKESVSRLVGPVGFQPTLLGLKGRGPPLDDEPKTGRWPGIRTLIARVKSPGS